MLETLAVVFEPTNFLAILIGTAGGIILGALPGIGTILALTMALPFTFVMEPAAGISLLMAVYAASIYGGSISAVLLNAPGTPQSASTCLDGYPMTLKGKADEALGWVTASSALGGLFSAGILVLAAPQLAKFSKAFGPIEIFSLLLFALVCVAWVSRESLVKGLIASLLGLFLAQIGSDPMTADQRFTFGFFQLSAGVQLIPLLVGLFALSEAFVLAGQTGGQSETPASSVKRSFYIPFGSAWRGRVRTLIKSSAIGTFFGLLPGPGAVISSFVAYTEAKRSSPNSATFGNGEPEGLVASESANNAVTGGALIPTLSLGIPGDAATAIMLTALMIHGIAPGPRLFELNGTLVQSIFVSLFIINVAILIFGTLLAPLFASILKAPKSLLVAAIFILSFVGVFTLRFSTFDLYTALCAGVVGLLLRKANFPLAPVVIGLVLGQRLELALRQGLILKDGKFLGFFESWISAGFLTITLAILAFALIQAAMALRRK